MSTNRRQILAKSHEPDDLFSDGPGNEHDAFFDVNQYLKAHKLIPIIGDTVYKEHIFDVDFDDVAGIRPEGEEKEEAGPRVSITEELAERWAEEVGYPLQSRFQIERVAQYLQVTQGLYASKSAYIKFQKKCLLRIGHQIAKLEEDAATIQLLKKLARDIDQVSFTHIVKELDFPRFPNGTEKEDPLRILARLPISIYVTTGYYDFIERALEAGNKHPRTNLCLWNLKPQNIEPEHRYDANFTPDPDHPIVFHLFGFEQYPESLVLSEDDCLDFLIRLARDEAGDSGNRVIPPYLEAELNTSSLLMLGYRLHDWDFRVLFRGLLTSNRETIKSRRPGIAIQLDPKDQPGVSNDGQVRAYLDKYFENMNFRVVLGRTDRFVSDLWRQWQPWAAGVDLNG